MTHPLRTLGALALGASIVAVAALTVRSGPVAGAPATDAAPHTITVSASGKVTIVPDVARVQLGVTIARPTVKAARDAGRQGDDRHPGRRSRASASPTPTSRPPT